MNGGTVLHHAAQLGQAVVAKLVVAAGCDVDAQADSGYACVC